MRLITAESSSVLSLSEQTGCVCVCVCVGGGGGGGGGGEGWGRGMKPGINVDCVMVD